MAFLPHIADLLDFAFTLWPYVSVVWYFFFLFGRYHTPREEEDRLRRDLKWWHHPLFVGGLVGFVYFFAAGFGAVFFFLPGHWLDFDSWEASVSWGAGLLTGYIMFLGVIPYAVDRRREERLRREEAGWMGPETNRLEK